MNQQIITGISAFALKGVGPSVYFLVLCPVFCSEKTKKAASCRLF